MAFRRHHHIPLRHTGLCIRPQRRCRRPGSQWYNIGHSRTSRPVFVTPRIDYKGNVDGHTALEGSSGYSPYMIRESMRLPQTLPNIVEIGDVPSAFSDLYYPGFSQWDFSLLKNFPINGESRYVQFRVEAENFFNHMNAGNLGRGDHRP